MVVMDVRDVLRDILGSLRVQYLQLEQECSSLEASSLDFQFRSQLYEAFDYSAFASSIMDLVPEESAIDYRDDFGLHYLVFQGQNTEAGTYFFFGPYLYRPYTEEDFRRLLQKHSLSENMMDTIRWYFKRIPIVFDVISWRHLFSSLLSRYLTNPDLQIYIVKHGQNISAKAKPATAVSSILYSTMEARYETEAKMLDAIRHGNFSEAIYYHNIFTGFKLNQRVDDPLRNAKDMAIEISTAMRKTVEQAQVHPMYIEELSGLLIREIEEADSEPQVMELVPRMIRHYCFLVRIYSREHYSSIVRDLLNYIDFQYMNPLSLESLSAQYSVNKNYLSTRFHKEVGMTVTDYINLARVRRSLDLLSSTAMSMPEIAERCGFSDANYYTRRFRMVYGKTPTEYRKSLHRK